MDEEFDRRIGLVGDGANLLQIQLAGQYQLGEALPTRVASMIILRLTDGNELSVDQHGDA
jgi:hypothetical protein